MKMNLNVVWRWFRRARNEVIIRVFGLSEERVEKLLKLTKEKKEELETLIKEFIDDLL